MNTGSCTLVGAGPGDPELLTLKAWRAIQSATVLLVDDLVSAEIVALAPAGARVIHVGKRGGCPSTPQDFITQLMIAEARRGERVVRLKGGDPFIFGRGGEEVERLQAASIQPRVINGITAGMAAASSLNLALTHREHAHGVLFVTGHARPGHAALDWRTLAACAHSARLTLVIYMGVSGVATIQQELLAGLPASTAASVIQNASLPSERHIVSTLGHLAEDMAQAGLGSPAVIVVGEVVAALKALSELPGADQPAAWRAVG